MARKPKPAPARTPVLEWIVAGLGLLLVLTVLGVLVSEVAAGPDSPAEIEVRVVSVQPSGARWRVAVEATNSGDAAAAQVGIVGELAGDPSETAEAVLDYLPGGGERPATLVFDGDPRGRPLTLRAVGWIEP